MSRIGAITLEDIARRARVSKMTVSFALRGHADAAPATRDRIRKLANEMGYRPNPLVVAHMMQLRANRRSSFAGTIGFVGAGESPEIGAPNTLCYRIFKGACRRAEALGYKIEWFSTTENTCDGSRLSQILTARGILGVALGSNCLQSPRNYLDWSRFALAAIGRTEIGHELHRAIGDSYRAVREACQRCRDRGYRRIGLAVSREHDISHQSLHRSALLGCQADWPAKDHVPVMIADDWSAAPFLHWVKRYRPEVVIASEDDPLHWLQAAGLRVPQDFGFLRPHLNDRTLGISGFMIDDDALGAAAIDLVVEQLNHNERGLPATVKRVLLPGRWYEGRTLRPRPVNEPVPELVPA